MRAAVRKIFNDTYQGFEHHKDENAGNALITFLTCLIVCISLVCTEYLGRSEILKNLAALCQFQITDITLTSAHTKFISLMWWAAVLLLFYVLIPILTIKLIFKKPLSHYGLSIKGAFVDWRLYGILMLIIIPFVMIASMTATFQLRYPFFSIQQTSDITIYFFLWELVYIIQFFAVEFFFRGFMLHGTKKTLGGMSILLMTIPYCMIHFHKPMPEAVAAIAAGLALGIVSLKHNSIWLGVLIHISVALTMDLASLWHKGIFD